MLGWRSQRWTEPPRQVWALVVVVMLVGWGAVGTARAAALPDGRAYELVSPPGKDGSDVMADSTRTRASLGDNPAEPMAAGFTSLGGFGDARGTGIATEYLSERDAQPGTSGWTTHAITPAQAPLTFLADFRALDPLYEGDFSPDLSKGVFRAWSPLTDAPNVKDVENLYVRNDLRASGKGSYTLASGSASPIPAFPFGLLKPFYAGASADFSHVVFESANALTPDATPGATNLYEAVNGAVRLAGVLPDSACSTPPCPAPASIAGQGAANAHYTPHVISADGSRIFFTDPTTGSDGISGTLYMRVDGRTTVQINASEKTSPESPQAATYQTASADGTRVLFTTVEGLTDDDTNNTVDLYMYDANAPAGHHLTRLSVDQEPGDVANDVQGVIGASDDGHYVYFIAAGQLVAGKPVLGTNFGIYLWHDGTIDYVGELAFPPDTFADLNTNWNLAPVDARVTPDGRHLVFSSHSGVGLTGYDHNTTGCGQFGDQPCTELYVYSADLHELACASCNPSGAPATADAHDNIHTGTGGANRTWHLSRAISDDGRRVFFSTQEALVPQDTNGRIDAYEYDVPSHSVRLLSTGKSTSDSYFMDASGNGDDVFILTRERLVGWDVDDSYDLYDVRVGGGFPDPVVPAAECIGEACHGQPSSAPPPTSAGTTTFAGPGNVKSRPKRPLKCRRGFVRKRVRGKVKCVKRPHRSSRKTKRAQVQRRAK
jgi:hypothetical protein